MISDDNECYQFSKFRLQSPTEKTPTDPRYVETVLMNAQNA